ncbi:MAG: hypothetical protein RI989_407, partial [Bacteroidota bacterium]
PTLCAQNKSLTAFLMLLTVVSLFNISWSDEKPKKGHHGSMEMVKLLTQTNLPVGDNGFFTGSGRCGGCHGDDPVDFANINAEGSDVSPATNWRGSMMANSAKDPFWKAKVNHEILVNPAHSQELLNKCTSCHAPVGRFTNLLQNNNPNYRKWTVHKALENILAVNYSFTKTPFTVHTLPKSNRYPYLRP